MNEYHPDCICEMCKKYAALKAAKAELLQSLKDVLESEYIDHTGTLTPVLHAGDLRGMIVKAIRRAEEK